MDELQLFVFWFDYCLLSYLLLFGFFVLGFFFYLKVILSALLIWEIVVLRCIFLRTELKFWCIGKGEGLENFGDRKNMIQIYLTLELFK